MNTLNNCQACEHRANPQGGHCYMFREEPQGVCYQHTSRVPGSGMTLNSVSDFTDSLVEIARSLIQEAPGVVATAPVDTPKVFESGGGGDFGGGGASGSWELPSISEAVDVVVAGSKAVGCVAGAVADGVGAVAEGAGEVLGAIAGGVFD